MGLDVESAASTGRAHFVEGDLPVGPSTNAIFSLPRPIFAVGRLSLFRAKYLILLGERGGTRTLDPMIKSHVLYRLSYALTCRAV
jgi:hypothetical protein